MIHYTNGLPEPSRSTKFMELFMKRFRDAIKIGYGHMWPIEDKGRDRKSKVEKFQEQEPEVLHQVWRYAVKASYWEIGIIYEIGRSYER
jgi:hypothetical protein